ncbi:methionine ABC transporter ATP-binding protein [Microbacterium ulmi]|uniref:Methionine ABC transporter ATP-binding protein n=1 Tax=Microbacterium ulmi TaxID=179095 RepID=A0A7Y2M0F0_9MICO|nr:methionine ABC transporter ATP-binding protein [Microbacterium ulmi]NII68919.1 D-methionine transport system ATP-binding protein [Microbacterium ulmi]NNH03902.1 methionine ABC transporter ATP-binding protein [Microbacterium ulmi]
MGTIIELTDVHKRFDVDGRTVTALSGVDLRIEAGEIFAIIGHSGAGKSTLVRIINGLERVTSGLVVVDGVDISTIPERLLRPVRRRTGMIFQQFNLFSSRTVAGNVAYPLRVAEWPKARRDARVAELLDFVGLLDRAHAYPDQLSGGQKQRVGIARALATSPPILLADESTSALDPETTGEVLRLLQRVNRELGVTVVVITHEMDVVRAIADRVAVISEGRIVERGSAFEVFSSPQSDTAQAFVATALHDRPSRDELARLRTAHTGRIVTARVVDGGGIGAVLSRAGVHDVTFELLHGAISTLQQRSFGSLTIALDGPDAGVDAVIAELSAVTATEEVAA